MKPKRDALLSRPSSPTHNDTQNAQEIEKRRPSEEGKVVRGADNNLTCGSTNESPNQFDKSNRPMRRWGQRNEERGTKLSQTTKNVENSINLNAVFVRLCCISHTTHTHAQLRKGAVPEKLNASLYNVNLKSAMPNSSFLGVSPFLYSYLLCIWPIRAMFCNLKRRQLPKKRTTGKARLSDKYPVEK